VIKDLKYHALLHVIIFIWGFTGILGKLIHLDAYPLVWHRTWIGFSALAIALVFMRKSLRVTSMKQLFSIAAVGIIVALHWMTFYKSIQLSTASLGILCLSTTTLHVTWLEPLLFRKKFSWVEFFLGLAVVYGIYFVSDEFDEKEYEALMYGLSSAFFAALFSVLNGQLSRRIPAHTISLYELISAFLFLTVFLFFQGEITAELFTMRTEDFLWLLFLGIVCTSFTFLGSIALVKRLGAFTVSLSINMEPVYTILLAIFILHENTKLSVHFYTGSAIIVLVVFVNMFLKTLLLKWEKSRLNG
jgi:drug/metabolite transporter (DMT)-like permease